MNYTLSLNERPEGWVATITPPGVQGVAPDPQTALRLCVHNLADTYPDLMDPPGLDAFSAARAAFETYAALETTPLRSERMSGVQVRLARWANKHFKVGNGALDAALGIGEELGELAEGVLGAVAAAGKIQHAVLKQTYGIRGFSNPIYFRRTVADAIADTSIFMTQLATHLRLDFGTLYRVTANAVMERRLEGMKK